MEENKPKIEPGYYWVIYKKDGPDEPIVVEIDKHQNVWRCGWEVEDMIDEITILARVEPLPNNLNITSLRIRTR